MENVYKLQGITLPQIQEFIYPVAIHKTQQIIKYGISNRSMIITLLDLEQTLVWL